MALRLYDVRHEVDYDGTVRLTLTYIQGREEARVDVTMSVNDGITADCEEIAADSLMDEILIEEHAEEFAEEHGAAFGEVEV